MSPLKLGHIPGCLAFSEENFGEKTEKFGAFRSVFKKVKKMDFPSYFEKMIWVGGDFFFPPKFFSEKAKHPGICPSLSGNVSET